MKTVAFYLPVFLNYSETFIYSLVKNIKSYNLIIICRERKNQDKFPHDRVFQVKNQRQIKRILIEQQVDLIHAQYGTFGADIMGTAQKLRIPLITHFRGQDAYQLPRNFFIRLSYRWLFSKAKKMLTVSEHMKQHLIDLGCLPQKIEVYYGGIQLPEFKDNKKLNKNNIKLIMAGRLAEKKGMLAGVLAVKEMIDRGYQLNLKIIGEGQLREKIRDLIKHNNLQERIELTGKMAARQLQEELYRADILLAPHKKAKNGDSEGIPNVIKEAMASGTLLVTTDHSGIPELVVDQQTGFVARENDILQLVQKLEEAINFQDISKIKINARRQVEKEFDIVKQTEKLENIYRAVLEKENG